MAAKRRSKFVSVMFAALKTTIKPISYGQVDKFFHEKKRMPCFSPFVFCALLPFSPWCWVEVGRVRPINPCVIVSQPYGFVSVPPVCMDHIITESIPSSFTDSLKPALSGGFLMYQLRPDRIASHGGPCRVEVWGRRAAPVFRFAVSRDA